MANEQDERYHSNGDDLIAVQNIRTRHAQTLKGKPKIKVSIPTDDTQGKLIPEPKHDA